MTKMCVRVQISNSVTLDIVLKRQEGLIVVLKCVCNFSLCLSVTRACKSLNGGQETSPKKLSPVAFI